MNNFSTVLSDVFDRGIERGFESLDDERVAIAKAKLGDQDATLALIYAYAPRLRAVVGSYRYAGGVWAGDAHDPHMAGDLRMAAVEGFIEAIHAFDPDVHHRLAAVVGGYVVNSLATYLVSPVAVTVPARTLKRFYGILREADGDPVKGAALAPSREMKVETFLAVLDAVRSADFAVTEDDEDDEGDSRRSVSSASPVWDGRYADAEDRVLVEAAFRAVEPLEGDVTRLAYGFADYDPVPDAEIGARMGLSRQKTQRLRSSALGKMREALGVA
jgi:DNA-directed RNA polymerase specialized sigma subunit